ncbi:MAG: prolyl oligopeptidase family serine peptidase [Paludibaculum sp.]
MQGHSWGGYQIAYMVTQTNRFKAAEAGAPVGNMTSAYSGIRWGSGMPRQFQYEKTQSRIGPSLYDNPLMYIENSPIFQVKRVETPMLILHDDNDDAVPWYQGIEFFLALRRTGQGSLPDELQRRVARVAATAGSEGLCDAHAAVLRSLPEGCGQAGVDGEGDPVH